jgi:hypothetical protein
MKERHKAFKQLEILQQGVAQFDQVYLDPDLPLNEAVRRIKVSRNMQRLWKDPVYRAKALEKQRGLGFRNYPDKV